MEYPDILAVTDSILSRAITERATAIHLETQADSLRVRYRVDGELVSVMTSPLYISQALVDRFKLLAELEPSERRIPLQGRFRFRHHDEDFEMHLSTLPCVAGEKVTIRIDKVERPRSLDRLGMSEANLQKLKGLLKKRSGLILVSGPSQSGKTTTMYSCLEHLSGEERSITTFEDQLLYRVPEFTQVLLNGRVGLTLAAALHSALHSDPDVLMIGLVRGAGALEMAVQAACSGHLVLAGSYYEGAVRAISSLLEMGVEPCLVAEAFRGGVGQRLARTICPACKGEGCQKCFGRGALGQLGVQEVLVNSPVLAGLMSSKAPQQAIFEAAVREGMVTMAEDATNKAKAGLLSPNEAARIFLQD